MTLDCVVCGAEIVRGQRCRECGCIDDSDRKEAEGQPDLRPNVDSNSTASSAPNLTTKAPGLTEPEIWCEVAAVLSVGVIPYLIGLLYSPDILNSSSFTVNTIYRSVITATVVYVTLYLIFRSGETWERFGIPQFWFGDLITGFIMLLVGWIIYALTPRVIYEYFPVPEGLFPVPDSRIDFALMIVSYGISAFGEEIVTRAYLITRFQQLFRSRAAAVAIAAAMFASYHLYQGLGGAINALLFGLAYGIAFLLLRSIWPLVIGHTLINVYFELSRL